MAYVTGAANSLADLLAAIQTACTSNGWTLSGDVLHKDACYCEVTNTGSYIKAQSGTGIDASSNLTGRANTNAAYMCSPLYFDTTVEVTWPVTYHVFIGTGPDEVYVHITHDIDCHQQIGWGISGMPGLQGSGNWYAGGNADRGDYGYSGFFYSRGSGEEIINGRSQSIALFANSNGASSGVDHALDGASWSLGKGCRDAVDIMVRNPNSWNGESLLVPVRCYANRPSGYISPVLECVHLRYVVIDNLSDGQIITLGTDRWMVFPWARRGGEPTIYATGSGPAGHAFRYDGP